MPEQLKPCCKKCHWWAGKIELWMGDDVPAGNPNPTMLCERFPVQTEKEADSYCGEFITTKAWNKRTK